MKGLDLCGELVRRATALGADEAEIYYLKTRKLEAVFEKNDLQVPKGDSYEGVGVRVIRDRRQGFAATNVLTRELLEDTISDAISIATASPEDPNHCLPEPSEVEPVPGIYDEKASGVKLEDVLDLGRRFIEAARGYDRRVTIDSASFTVRLSEQAVVNSKGVSLSQRGSAFTCIGMGFARDGDEVSSFDVEYSASCVLSGVDPAAIGRRLGEKVVRSLGAATIPSFRGVVIITPYAGPELIAGPIEFSTNAENVQNGRSQWKGKIGSNVATGPLSLVDDPRIPGGIGSTAFDREGVPPEPLQIIAGGTLNHYLYNCYTARKERRRSNGRAVGSDQSLPGIGTTNLVFAPGKTPLDEIVRSCPKGLMVNRFSGTLDPISGDFSGVVKGGHYIENGELARPVKEVMIAGNIYELLHHIIAVSREVVTLGDTRMPYIQIDGVSVTGK